MGRRIEREGGEGTERRDGKMLPYCYRDCVMNNLIISVS